MKHYNDIPDALKEKFGRNARAKQLYARAIRDEFPFGDDLLNLKGILYQIGFRSNRTKEAYDFLQEAYGRIDAIRNILAAEIDRRYENPERPEDYFQAIETLELWLLDLNEYITFKLQKDTEEAVKVSRRLVKIMIRKYIEAEREKREALAC